MSHPLITMPREARTIAHHALAQARQAAQEGLIARGAVRHEAKLWAWLWSLESDGPCAPRYAILAMNYLSDDMRHAHTHWH